MALERIDPFDREDPFCVDHLMRYAWAARAVEGKRVLDAACGTGFGTVVLAHGNAGHVVGLDLSEEAVSGCRDNWSVSNAEFVTGDVARIEDLGMEAFDMAVTFETLEHVPDPWAALRSLKGAMREGGLLLGSVPGETDADSDNEFHLHRFGREELTERLRGEFRHVKVFRQLFRIASFVEELPESPALPVEWRNCRMMQIDFGHADEAADTYLFAASDAPLPELAVGAGAVSRQAWYEWSREMRSAFAGAKAAHAELRELHRRYRALFVEKGDLQRQFTNVLGWGQYHYEQCHGRTPEQSYLETIRKATSDREETLSRHVGELQAELEKMRGEIAGLRDELGRTGALRSGEAAKRRRDFGNLLESRQDQKI